MAPLRWGIAACGKISNKFACGLACLPPEHHELVAVAARELEGAKKFAETYEAKKYYEGYENLAKDPEVDVVYIGSIHPKHLEIGLLMLDHGKHILCEKPLCMNQKQAKKLLNHAKSKNLFCMEAIWSRFFPAYIHLKNRIDNGDLGEIKEVNISFGSCLDHIDRVIKKSLGGGAILDLGIYAIQMSQWVFRESPSSITASGTLNEEGVDLQVSAVLTYSNGAKANLNISAKDQYDNTAVIKGTKGKIEIPLFWRPTSLTDIDGTVINYELPINTKTKNEYPNSAGLSYQAEEVRRCINQGLIESPSVTHADSLLIAFIEDEFRRQIGVKYPEDEEL